MEDYNSRYSFRESKVSPTPISNSTEGITDSRFRFNIPTKEIIKSYKLIPQTNPVLLVPLRWNEKISMWELATSDSWINASVDSNNYLNTHVRLVDQLPSSLSSDGNLKIDIEESKIRVPVDKQSVYRNQIYSYGSTLSANYVMTSPSFNVLNYSNFAGFFYSDVDGKIEIQTSDDNSNFYTQETYTLTGGTPVFFDIGIIGEYYRFIYTNGSNNQSKFKIAIYVVTK